MMRFKNSILIILGVFIMGTGNLPDLASSPTKVNSTTEQYNAITDSLQGHQVMRDDSGVAEDNTSDIGRPSSGRPRKIYVGTGLNVAGQDIDLSSIALQTTGISSGKSKSSGFPNYLTPEGTTGGATNTFTIEGSVTPLELTIDGAGYILETDLTSDDLSLAPSSNNTCLVDNVLFTNLQNTKTVGEYGYWIGIDATGGVGSEITSLDGTVQVFKLENSLTGTGVEYFIGTVDTTNNKLIPFRRGVGGTERIVFGDGDTITLLKAHYIFLDNDLATIDTTTTYPTWSATAPTTPSTGDYWWDVTNETWKRYSGSSWEQLGRIFLGYAICDSADCVAVEHDDFNLAWSSDFSAQTIDVYGSTGGLYFNRVRIDGSFSVNVAGKKINIQNMELNLTDHYSEPSSNETKWCYVYIDKHGVGSLSTTTPRIKNSLKGYYHPTEYLRCLSCFQITSGPTMQKSVHSVSAGVITSGSSFGSITIGSEVFHFSNDICPLSSSASFGLYLTHPDATTLCTIDAYDVNTDKLYRIYHGIGISASNLDKFYSVRISFIRNGAIVFDSTNISLFTLVQKELYINF